MSSKPGRKMSDPTHSQVKQFVCQHSRPFVTSKEVAEEFGSVSRRTLNNRLNALVDRGELEKRRVGAQSVVWYCTEAAVQNSPSEIAARPASDSQ